MKHSDIISIITFLQKLQKIHLIPSLKCSFKSCLTVYYQVKPYFKYNQVIQNHSKNKEIVILKQDKGRGVVILDRRKYMEKCFSILSTSQFAETDHDPTAYIEEKAKRILRKITNKLPSFVYLKIYQTASLPGKFYGTAKLHKVSNNSTVEHLPLRPITFNIGIMTTYDLAKYLAQLLKPLSKSQYTITNTKTFTKSLNKMTIPLEYKMV